MNDILIIKWDNETQKYFLSRVGEFTDSKGNSFIGEENLFAINKPINKIIDFLSEV